MPRPCAVSTMYFSSSGVPDRLAGAKKEVTCADGRAARAHPQTAGGTDKLLARRHLSGRRG